MRAHDAPATVDPSSRTALRDRPARVTGRSTTGASIREDLQGLRGLAVVGVVVFHLRDSWLPGGFAGVDVFFVLSGYFITGLLIREIESSGTVRLSAFWARRARRLLPASMLVTCVTLLSARVLTNALETQRVAHDATFAVLFGMNWREVATGLAYGQDPNPSPFQHYWSLGVEEQFYLAWPLVIVVIAVLVRRGSLSARRAIATVLVPAAVVSFLFALHQTTADQPSAYYGTFDRIWQLALGGIIAAAIPFIERQPRWLLVKSRFVGLAAVLGFFVAAPSVTSYPGWWSTIPAFGAALIIVAGDAATTAGLPARLLRSRPARLGGQYSYGWYLWHWAPLVLLPISLGRPLRVYELWLCALASFLLAVLTFHLLEDPIRTNRWLAHSRGTRSLWMGAALIVLGLIAAQWTVRDARTAVDHVVIVTTDHQALTPTPAQAERERPVVSRDGCQLPIRSARLAPDCRYLPNTGHGDVVLVGDSHAGMWFPAVDEIAKRNSWGLRAWMRTSCPFADVQKTVAAGGEYRYCDRWRADVIRRLVAARPSLVIVTSYAQSGLHVDDPRTGSGATQSRAHQLFQAGMERCLRQLRAAGIRVLVIADVPAFDQSAPDCVVANQHHLARCSLAEPAAIPYGGVDRRAARAVPGVKVVDFAKYFCPKQICHQVIGHELAYRDTTHLTTEMALSLVPALDAAARAAIR